MNFAMQSTVPSTTSCSREGCRTMPILHRLSYFFLTSYVAAISGYNILKAYQPEDRVFGSLFRMFTYHSQFPDEYIMIVCAVFALVATFMLHYYSRQSTSGRIAITAGAIFITILLSSPLGGMLWHYHDILAGWWPGDYAWKKLFIKGPVEGLMAGWLVILLSFPYSYLGAVVGYFILFFGTKLFPDRDKHRINPEPLAQRTRGKVFAVSLTFAALIYVSSYPIVFDMSDLNYAWNQERFIGPTPRRAFCKPVYDVVDGRNVYGTEHYEVTQWCFLVYYPINAAWLLWQGPNLTLGSSTELPLRYFASFAPLRQ